MHRRRHIAVLTALAVLAALSVSPFASPGGAELVGTSPSGEPYAVAFVAGSSAPPSGDRVLHRRLVNAGFAVTTIDDDVATPANLGDVDIVVVSSSVVPAKVAWLAEVDIPLLTWEGKGLDDLGLASKSGETSQSWTAVQLDAGGPLAGGFTGKPAVYTGAAPMSWGTPSPDADVAGTETGGQRRAVYFAYDAGDTLANGDEAAARRIAFFPTYESVAELNATGLKLFDAAVTWLLPDVVPIQILGFNDFHGNLEPPSGSSGRITLDDGTTVDAGGAAYLAAHLATLEAENPDNTAIVSAGDMIGASPFVSAAFHDEPTIEAGNLWGLDYNAVGNHEFDEGQEELLRMQDGGPHPVDGDIDGDPFEGADFQFLAANVEVTATGDTLLPPYGIEDFDGVEVAFIGETLEGTPDIVTATGIAGLEFHDEADTVNALIPELEAEGADIIVLLIHEGGVQNPITSPPNGCNGISGAIVDIVDRLDPAVDIVVSGHTHQPYNCVIDGRPVTSAYSFGRVITDYDLEFDRSRGGITAMSIDNTPVLRTVTPDPEVESLVNEYKTLSAPVANRPVGSITADITRTQSPVGESALGNVIADAQLEATTAASAGGAQVAFMNPGGIRGELTYAPDGVVTFGEVFTVQPFNNYLVTLTLTGAQVDALLEQQWNATRTAVLQVSADFSYKADLAAPFGSRASDIMLNGTPIDPAAQYRVTVNSFLAGGGDGFTILTQGSEVLFGGLDIDAFEDYLVANDPLAPPALGRIVQVG